MKSDIILFQRLGEARGLHLFQGAAGDPGNFSITLRPDTAPDPVGLLLDLLGAGWEEFELPMTLPAWDALAGVVHVGVRIQRRGYTVDVVRAYPAEEMPEEVRRAGILEDVLARLRATPHLEPLSDLDDPRNRPDPRPPEGD